MRHLSLPFLAVVAIVALSHVALAAEDDKSAWRTLPLVKDGKLADEWAPLGFGRFAVEDGGIVRTDCDPRGMGLLVYKKQPLGNCQVRIVYKAQTPRSNSGVYIRIDEGILKEFDKAPTPVRRDADNKLPPEELAKLQKIAEAEEGVWYAVHHGFEVQIADGGDAAHRTGAIYGLAKAEPAPPPGADGWRTMVITLDGTKVLVDIDGKRVTTFDSADIKPPAQRNWTEPKLDSKRPESGYLGLQAHDPGDVVLFKEVAVRPLPDK